MDSDPFSKFAFAGHVPKKSDQCQQQIEQNACAAAQNGPVDEAAQTLRMAPEIIAEQEIRVSLQKVASPQPGPLTTDSFSLSAFAFGGNLSEGIGEEQAQSVHADAAVAAGRQHDSAPEASQAQTVSAETASQRELNMMEREHENKVSTEVPATTLQLEKQMPQLAAGSDPFTSFAYAVQCAEGIQKDQHASVAASMPISASHDNDSSHDANESQDMASETTPHKDANVPLLPEHEMQGSPPKVLAESDLFGKFAFAGHRAKGRKDDQRLLDTYQHDPTRESTEAQLTSAEAAQFTEAGESSSKHESIAKALPEATLETATPTCTTSLDEFAFHRRKSSGVPRSELTNGESNELARQVLRSTLAPVKRRRVCAKVGSARRLWFESDPAFTEADALGLGAALRNLASRDEIMRRGIPIPTLLAALTEADGLVNKAKAALLVV